MNKLIQLIKNAFYKSEVDIEGYWIKLNHVDPKKYKDVPLGCTCIDESGSTPLLIHKSESGNIYFVPMKKMGFKD